MNTISYFAVDSFGQDNGNVCDTTLDEETDHKPREAEIKKKSKKKSKNALVTTETSTESNETGTKLCFHFLNVASLC